MKEREGAGKELGSWTGEDKGFYKKEMVAWKGIKFIVIEENKIYKKGDDR